ncbi:MAG TPA: hypothetical protein VLA96_07260 [Terriglobales bacterium]|nr:hypothetical protein [Terriglobales bacterium]
MRKMFAMFLMLVLGTAMSFAQTAAAPAKDAPKADDHKMACCHKGADGKMADCCKDCPKDKDGKMACMKDGKCTADCPMMKDGKMACMKDGKCAGGDCPMKDGKMACMKDGKCTDDCPMMKKDNKSTASAEHKGCCGGDKCAAGHMHEGK